MLCRVYDTALVKSLLMTVKGENTLSTLQRMSEHGRGRYDRSTFIGVPYNTGNTSYPKTYTPKQKSIMAYSFGTMNYFFRFSFTSAINLIPFACVNWVEFEATRFSRTTFEGNVTSKEWWAGPQSRVYNGLNPYVPLSDLIPSRFAMAYKDLSAIVPRRPHNVSTVDVAFIAMDPERVGDINDDGVVTDLGDNELRYNGGKPFLEADEIVDGTITRKIPLKMRLFMKADLSKTQPKPSGASESLPSGASESLPSEASESQVEDSASVMDTQECIDELMYALPMEDSAKANDMYIKELINNMGKK